jgi:hypothetical protein
VALWPVHAQVLQPPLNVKGQQVKYTIAEIHASSMRRLSKVEAADDPSDGADEA